MEVAIAGMLTIQEQQQWKHRDQEGCSLKENIRIYEDCQRELKVVFHCDPLSVWNINILS